MNDRSRDPRSDLTNKDPTPIKVVGSFRTPRCVSLLREAVVVTRIDQEGCINAMKSPSGDGAGRAAGVEGKPSDKKISKDQT